MAEIDPQYAIEVLDWGYAKLMLHLTGIDGELGLDN